MIRPGQNRRGLTRVEMVVLIVILVLVIGYLLPLWSYFHRAHVRTQTILHLTQLGKATHKFASQNNGKLPYNGTPIDGVLLNGKSVNVFYLLLPFVEQEDAYNNGTTSTFVPAYTAPQDATAPSTGLTSQGQGVVSFAGNAALFNSGKVLRLPADFASAKPSNVVLFGTARAVCGDTERAWSTLRLSTAARGRHRDRHHHLLPEFQRRVPHGTRNHPHPQCASAAPTV
jgi:hypothetical protein